MWESFLNISYKGDLNLGKQSLVTGDGGQVLALREQGRDLLPGAKPTALRDIRDLGIKGETFF